MSQSHARPWAPVVLAAWLIPGGGHLFLRRKGRALFLGGSVLVMFLAGLMMRGPLFVPEAADNLLSTAINYGGFIGNLACGMLYFLTKWFGYSQPDLAGHMYDYGSKFLVSAGMLNILAMVDAYEIAVGKKD
jgi:hypothetical protein